MIWLAIVALVFVAGGTWFVAKSMQTRAIVLVAGVVAVGAYWYIGHPDMGDRPLDRRLDEAQALLASSPEKVEVPALIALIENKIRERPDDPIGHLLIARQYKRLAQDAQDRASAFNQAGDKQNIERQLGISQTSLEEAEQALTEYVRLGGKDPVAMGELADLRFVRTTDVDPGTTALFMEAFAADPQQLRMGYLAGIGLWKQGKTEEAEKLWADIDKRTPADAPLRQMYAAMRNMFGIDKPVTPENPSQK